MNDALAEKIVREHAAVAATLPPAVVSVQRRSEALRELLTRGLPSGRDENWRYANLRTLGRAAFAPAEPAEVPGAPALEGLPEPVPGYLRCLVLDGVLQGERSAPLPAGVTVTSLRTHPVPRGASATANATTTSTTTTTGSVEDRFALLNEAFALDGLVIATSPSGSGHPPPDANTPGLELVFLSSGHAAAYPRVRIDVAAGTRLRLLERHVGGSAATLTNALTEITVGPRAMLDHVRVQTQVAESTWIDTLDAAIEAGADYRLQQYGVGARSARSTLRLRLAAADASLALYCAMIAEGQQTADTYVRVEHAAPRTRSRQDFRGIGAGRSRVAFNSHVVVNRGAHGADSRQSLRTLVAGKEAEVDARPQLEIYTDDVKCSHGATAGKLDENMLFYMLSRGLEPDTAQSLLKWAFLEDTVAHIADLPLRAAIEQVLAAHLHDETIAAGRSA